MNHFNNLFELVKEIKRTHASRENVMGDPISLLNAKAALSEAIDKAIKYGESNISKD